MRMFELAETRRVLVGLTAAGLLSVSVVAGAAAQETSSAGNGGSSNVSANGGAVGMTDVDSGSNSGSTTAIGDIVSAALASGGEDIASSIISQVLGE